MRSLLALGFLIPLCASADAVNSAFALSTRLANVRIYNLHRSMSLTRSRFLYRNYGNPDGATSPHEDGYTLWNGRSASKCGGQFSLWRLSLKSTHRREMHLAFLPISASYRSC
jgi:hypothetical protein